MAVSTYDPALHDLIFAGIRLNEGLADGTFIAVEFNAESFTKKVGADGSVTRARMADRSGSITLSLMQTSELNDVLSALHNADRVASNGAGVGALLLQDRGGSTKLQASSAWIAQQPGISLEMEASTRDWVIDFADGDAVHGGNADV